MCLCKSLASSHLARVLGCVKPRLPAAECSFSILQRTEAHLVLQLLQEAEAESNTEAHTTPEAGVDAPKVFNFWGVANALADSVKKTTADIQARFARPSLQIFVTQQHDYMPQPHIYQPF